MIDSHCHLDQSPLIENLNNVLFKSKEIGIEKLLTISTTKDSFKKILNLVEYDPIIYGTFGIHPHEADKELLSIDEIIANFSVNSKIIGIGETGLDFYYNNSSKEKQLISFKNHIEASIKLNSPLIVHSRSAENETFDLLYKYRNDKLKIIMHCFTGSNNFAQKLLEFNTYFSASGIITFKNSIDLQNTFKSIPLERLLIETDSPFLSPDPMRGKKNEPSYLKFTLKKLSELKATNLNKLDKITTNNFNKLFF